MLSPILIERLRREQEYFRELEEKLGDPQLMQDAKAFKEITREHSRLESQAKAINHYLRLFAEWQDNKELLEKEKDKEMRSLAQDELTKLRKEIERGKREIELALIAPSPHEERSLFMEIRAGTGGSEAALFVSDLARMYMRFAERQGLRAELIHSSATELGGYKEIIFSVAGKKAYQLLHQEGGTHRVQRIPSTESKGRIHTSAVTVAVLPEREESEIEIKDSDIKIDVFRASGAGGQHVNKTESAIRITHLVSGIVISCQDERSQHKNKARAMSVLRSRLAERQEEAAHSEENTLKREQVKSGDRSERIRTYNFPQGRVTDHRIGYTAYTLEALMDGDMEELLHALIEGEREEKLQAIQV